MRLATQSDRILNLLADIREGVREAAVRLADIGRWPSWFEGEDSLTTRVPNALEERFPGFDAGIACAMDLIPRDKQRLSAVLHAAYTKEAVEQVRRESARFADAPDSETVWWLAASAMCAEGGVTGEGFLNQTEAFRFMARAPADLLIAAEGQLRDMTTSFETSTYGIPFGTKDGCIQGAYLAGHRFGTWFSEDAGIAFIGTYERSLGLEGFPWSGEKDEQGRAKSGPVHGSRQFAKCASIGEFLGAVRIVREHLS